MSANRIAEIDADLDDQGRGYAREAWITARGKSLAGEPDFVQAAAAAHDSAADYADSQIDDFAAEVAEHVEARLNDTVDQVARAVAEVLRKGFAAADDKSLELADRVEALEAARQERERAAAKGAAARLDAAEKRIA